jgi:hypothetical protein
MIVPSPMQFALWGSALYRELATGVWLALAAPWLETGWPRPPCACGRPRPAGPGPAPAAMADAADSGQIEASVRAEVFEPKVIEVPAARWRGRRAAQAE